MKIARFRSWARAVLHRSKMEREMDAELRFHIEHRVEDLVRSGHAADDARRLALTEFGGIETRKDEMREAVGLRVLDELRADIVYALRMLRKAPAFTTVAVLSLALGIGANTAIFSLMEAALWKSIPTRSPETLRLLSWVSGPRRVMNGINGNLSETATGGSTSTSFSYAAFLEFQRQDAVFETVFGFKPVTQLTAVIDGQAEVLTGQLVSGRFYEGLGVVPIAGRPIIQADDVRDAPEAAALISDAFWSRRFGRDPAVLGKRIAVNQVPVTIIGVNPPGFVGLELGQDPDVFLPLSRQPAFLQRPGARVTWMDNPDVWWVYVVGRLTSGIAEVQAQTALDVVLQQTVRESLPDRTDRDQPHIALLSGARGFDELTEEFKQPLLILLTAVGMVLLIACANVANLLLARAAARQREISLRLAIGAGPWRIMRQLITEGLVLAAFGGAVGLLLGYWLRDSVPALLAPAWRPEPFQAEFNGRVLVLAAVTAIATGILFSLAPAWRSARIEVGSALKERGGTFLTDSRWSRSKVLVAVQICVSLVLLVGAGLFARTLVNLRSETLGFRPERILLFNLNPSGTSYPGDKRKALFDEIEQQIGRIPGVEAVSLSADPLVGQGSSLTTVGPADQSGQVGSQWRGQIPTDDPLLRDSAWVNDVGPRFFETMGIPILRGRSFGPSDRQNSPRVAVVSQQFVKKFLPSGDPVGQTFKNGDRLLQIIGISGDARYDRLRTPFPPTFYRLYLQEPGTNLGSMTFEVRTATSEGSVVSTIRNVVRSIDRNLPMFEIRTQTQQIDATLSQERLFVALTTALAALALALACIGIYGITANGVARRTNEIGIRIALGAQRRNVVEMIVGETVWLAGVGIVIGVLAATGLTRYIRATLYGVQPIDPLTISGAVAIMFAVALVAGWIPARRASRLEPMVALRCQ
jgi:predicted permease